MARVTFVPNTLRLDDRMIQKVRNMFPTLKESSHINSLREWNAGTKYPGVVINDDEEHLKVLPVDYDKTMFKQKFGDNGVVLTKEMLI